MTPNGRKNIRSSSTSQLFGGKFCTVRRKSFEIGLLDSFDGRMEFHEKLEYLIDLRGISKTELSEKTRLSKSAISDMTSNKRRPYLDQGKILADALEVSLDYLADPESDGLPTEDGLTENEKAVIQAFHDLNELLRREGKPELTGSQAALLLGGYRGGGTIGR